MLFAKPILIQNILAWVVVALAALMFSAIIYKCIRIYRNLKKNRAYVKHDSEAISKIIAIRGEYFVLSCGVEYCVGESGQLAAGNYLVRGDGYDKFQLNVNGECRDFEGDSSVELCEGDTVQPTTCDVLIKPTASQTEQI